MAGAAGDTDTDLVAALQAEPHRFDFYQAVRRLDALQAPRPPTGQAPLPRGEALRFHQEVSLAFAPSTVARVTTGPDERLHLWVHFMGLLGPQGPLPLHLTQWALERAQKHGDTTFARFLDIFHHRMISLLYRAWASSRKTVQHDRPELDRMLFYQRSLLGLGPTELHERGAVPDVAKVHVAGVLGQAARNPAGLRSILSSYFGVPVAVREYVGEWLELPADAVCRLGASPSTGALGLTTIVGRRLWQCHGKFRLVLGPLSWAEYVRFLPGGESLTRLRGWVQDYLGSTFTWEVQLILRASDVPPMVLGQGGGLGWTTWTASQPPTTDASNLVLGPF